MVKIGNYEILKQIGEGGFAKTYLAKHVFLDEEACIKQNINVTKSDGDLLRREAKMMWNLNHHSLPSVKDFISLKDGSFAIAMSYAKGNDLEQIVKNKGPIHPEDVCWITQRLLQALHYIHAKGTIHSDIKPQNIIVQPKEHNVVLIDYGLSALRPKGDTTPIGYTQAFAAPELLEGKPPIPESDLYGVGLTMMYALGGDPVSKSYPKNIDGKIKEFCDELVKYDPMQRPNWEKVDLIKKLSDMRLDVFKRRYSI
ncbi:MAG: serine/threonine-protein kinase [Candidatus Woesearchaeota archaeon]|jgi:serine/threonine protein kinase